MYKIEPLNNGRYENIELGARYTLTFKSALRIAKIFHNSGAKCRVSRLIRVCDDIFCWSETLSEKQTDKLCFDDEEND